MIKRKRVEFPSTILTLSHFTTLSWSFVLCSMREVVVGFVDIGGIVDNHCLNFVFHNHYEM